MQTVLQQNWTLREFLREVHQAQIKEDLWALALTSRTGTATMHVFKGGHALFDF